MASNIEDIDFEFYDAMCKFTNSLDYFIVGPGEGSKDAPTERQMSSSYRIVKERMSNLYETKPIIDTITIYIEGEHGTGGKPMKRKNPYLEIDLIDPTDPIVCEGEVQKYKPGFKPTFIDRWV